MPELPEVVTVCKILNQEVSQKIIRQFEIFYPPLLVKPTIEEFKMRVKEQRILRVFNLAKYLIFELENDVIISHLRMEGRWAYEKPELFSYPENLLEAQFWLDNGFVLRYYDFRRFGTLELAKKADYLALSSLSKLGPMANDSQLTGQWLMNKLVKIKRPIKSVLLEQNILSGIGNIYANEILFAVKIDPHTPANLLNLEQNEAIIQSARQILNQAIRHGGTTIHSFAPKFGASGGYQDFLRVHGKEGRACPCCGGKIVKEIIGGRGTYYCLRCQS